MLSGLLQIDRSEETKMITICIQIDTFKRGAV